MAKITLYDAFTKISSWDKSRVLNFLSDHLDCGEIKADELESAVDYAVKDVPSFGGFIVNVEDDAGNIIGSSIIMKTGMKGFSSGHLLSFLAVHREHRSNGVFNKLINKTLEKTSGDVALHINECHPNYSQFQSLGFVPRYVEMRLNA